MRIQQHQNNFGHFTNVKFLTVVVNLCNFTKIIKNRTEATQYGTTLLIIMSLNSKLIAPNTVDDIMEQYKKLVINDTRNLFILIKGIASLGPKLKKLSKQIEEQSQEFYRDKRNRLKKKLALREKMPTSSNTTLFKIQMKIAFLYEMVHNKTSAIEHYKIAYNLLTNALPNLQKMFDIWEIKAVADALEGKLCKHYLESNDAKQVITLFCNHYPNFKQKIYDIESKQLYLEYKWRADQLKRQAGYLQNEILESDSLKKKDVGMWLSFLYFVSSIYAIHNRHVQKC